MSTHLWLNAGLRLLTGSLLIAVIGTLVLAAQRYEGVVMPVVDRFTVEQAQAKLGGVVLSGTMHKDRDCRFEELATYATLDQSGRSDPVQVIFLNKRISTRAAIEQGWGPWRVKIPTNFQTADLTMYAIHRCHAAWLTTTKLAVFRLDMDDQRQLTITQ